ncbi:hypothetical protein TrST_g11138 [Triparma strigata]|uniref:AMP-dependent synthetase/ligase domain-containing protein n=1 Tax=Triparma strigata TaxID=1606541 RepID=A0A9W7C322_9STRA|nr:hypothetical protein TrST_g11138 [Triparma strigata]
MENVTTAYTANLVGQSSIFLNYLELNPSSKEYVRTSYSRASFFTLVCRYAAMMKAQGIVKGSRAVHLFSCNTLHDLALRTASVLLGSVPVTVNWGADTTERILYKISKTGASVIFTDGASADKFEFSKIKLSTTAVICNVDEVFEAGNFEPIQESEFVSLEGSDVRIIIFTSGTTGDPKGVELSYDNYKCNAKTFTAFLLEEVGGVNKIPIFNVVNPMHHTNSTSMTDWALRTSTSTLNLFSQYSAKYWKCVNEVAEGRAENSEVIMPLVSRHFDFLRDLVSGGKLPVKPAVLKENLSKCILLLGSAPVGPTTVQTIQGLCGTLPTVRFGSTETCLQVMGTPKPGVANGERLAAFKKGWEHSRNGQDLCGYYIGRPHDGLTEVIIVKNCEKGKDGYMVECEAGEPGLLVVKGRNVMKGYVSDPAATAKAFEEGWYVNLGDVCFYFPAGEGGSSKDVYWLSRESNLMIRGGTNYSYEQVNAELTSFLEKEYHLEKGKVEVAVVGLKIDSEHEDSCCVTISLFDEDADRERVEATFLDRAKASVSKGAKPTHFMFGQIPKTFKGSILTKDLVKRWEAEVEKKGVKQTRKKKPRVK